MIFSSRKSILPSFHMCYLFKRTPCFHLRHMKALYLCNGIFCETIREQIKMKKMEGKGILSLCIDLVLTYLQITFCCNVLRTNKTLNVLS